MAAPASFVIRPYTEPDRDAVLAIVARLEGWFNDDGRRNLAVDLAFQRVLVAVSAERVAGFLTYFAQDAVARIGWMGVDTDAHRRGIGRRLVERLLAILREAGVEEVQVHTLGASVDYEPYERTRAFYAAVGFELLSSTMQDDEGCPELWVLSRRTDG